MDEGVRRRATELCDNFTRKGCNRREMMAAVARIIGGAAVAELAVVAIVTSPVAAGAIAADDKGRTTTTMPQGVEPGLTPAISSKLPAWSPYVEGMAPLEGTRLYYRDSGGSGPVVVLEHPNTGSALIWGYQQPALVKAGYRVIAYSRRGHFGSEPGDPNIGGFLHRDLDALMNYLNVGRFSIVASAMGASVALSHATEFSRVDAIVAYGGSYSDIVEPSYRQILDTFVLPGFDQMPHVLREVGPTYRGANPEGTRAWMELQHIAINANRLAPKLAVLNWETLARIKTPTLFIAGGSDMYAPPTIMRHVSERVPNAKLVVMPDIGHSGYWEQPETFNRLAIQFLKKHVKD